MTRKYKAGLVAGAVVGVSLTGLYHWPVQPHPLPPGIDSPIVSVDLDRPCGPVSACVALRLLGRPVGLAEVARHVPSDYAGRTSMAELVGGLRATGVWAEG